MRQQKIDAGGQQETRNWPNVGGSKKWFNRTIGSGHSLSSTRQNTNETICRRITTSTQLSYGLPDV